MRTKKQRIISLLMAFIMTFSMSGCFGGCTTSETLLPVEGENSSVIEKQEAQVQRPVEEDIQAAIDLQEAQQAEAIVAPAEYDRESMEEIAELLGADKDEIEELDDEEISVLVEDLLEETDGKHPSKSDKDDSDDYNPSVDIEENDSAYNDDGTLTKPFDQIYPELVAEGEVEYDDKTLLIKMSNSRNGEVTKAMSEAGVSVLEAVVPMEKSTWYEAKLFPGADPMIAVATLRDLDEIQMVDFNYEVETTGMADVESVPEVLHKNPHHDKQWHLKYCRYPTAHEELKNPGGSASVIVAVIDTGVDYDHEDLSQNIWTNINEIPDNGKDDDGNGYIDDYYGVNVITGKGNGDDDNGHGTHVAGIIAAQDNNIGVVGMAYNVKVMPIKAAMSNGAFLQSDVAKAILYAYEHGAEVINMSFGGTACSIAVQDALSIAYSRCVLVASAGNDGSRNEGFSAKPNYPAALSYVLGVMSVGENGMESAFSNYDAKQFNKVEYEVYAPGEGIMSTIPNDKYASWSGTSMAAPVVSSVAAILRSEYPDHNTYPTKFIYGQISATSDDNAICIDEKIHGQHNLPSIVNLYDTLTKTPTPNVGLHDYAIFDTAGFSQDTAGKNNGDGVIDAGETIALGLYLRNQWGQADNVTVAIDTLTLGGTTDPYIEIINPEINFGAIGTYSIGDSGAVYADDMLTAWESPFYIHIKEDCPNDYTLTLNVNISAENGLDENDTHKYSSEPESITLTVRSGEVLPAIIEEDMTLTSGSLYIIPNSTTIMEGTTVTVEPGTHIQFWSNDPKDPYADQYIANLDVKGALLVNGTAGDMVYIYPSALMDNYIVDLSSSGNGYVELNYVDITNWASPDNNNIIDKVDHCIFRQNYNDSIRYRFVSTGTVKNGRVSDSGEITKAENTVFYKYGYDLDYNFGGNFNKCIFADCAVKIAVDSSGSFTNCVFLGNNSTGDIGGSQVIEMPLSSLKFPNYNSIIEKVVNNKETGKTYVLVNITSSSGNIQGKSLAEVLEAYGLEGVSINTPEELEWIDTNLDTPYGFTLNLKYDSQEQEYKWSDGTSIGEFIDPNGVSQIKTGETHVYNGSEITTTTGHKHHYVCEVSGEIPPDEILLNSYMVNLDLECTHQIVPTAIPETDKFIYESKDETVAIVDENGLVTPVANGTTDIYVYSIDKAVYNYVTVNVADCIALESIVFAKDSIDLLEGEMTSAAVVLTPTNTTRNQVTYSSSDESVATVDAKGNITAISHGSATITAECEGLAATATVNVYRAATDLSIDYPSYTFSLLDEAVELPGYSIENGEDAVLEWRSTDPAVAEIEDESLKLNGAGTTSLILTDKRSGLSATALVYVTEKELPVFVKSTGSYLNTYSLTNEGKVYAWKWSIDGSSSAELFLEGVADFGSEGDMTLFLMEDGTLKYCSSFKGDVYELTDYFIDQNVEKIEVGQCNYRGKNYYVLTEDGYVYVWGDNRYGQLGLGHKNQVDEPTMVNIEDVVDIRAGDYNIYFLTANGDLYTSGGTGTDSPISPTLEEENVSRFENGSSMLHFQKGDVTEKYSMCAYYEVYSSWLAVKDGKLYKVATDGTATFIPTNGNVTVLFRSSDKKFHIATDKGMLYAYNGTDFVNIPTFVLEEDDIALVSSNIDASGVLAKEKLVLEFNKILSQNGSQIALFANDAQIPVTIKVEQNIITLSLSAGFQEEILYRVLINSLESAGNLTLTQPIELEFTTALSIEETPEKTPEVVHSSQRDESIERSLPTVESLQEEISKKYESYTFNPWFSGNAILNRTKTDTNPENWLRVVASSANSSGAEDISLGGNYWGTTNKTLIGKQIVDYSDYNTYDRIRWENFLAEAPEDTFPFITDVAIFDENGDEVKTVGAGEMTVQVFFNRDMDTTIPLRASFGSAYPYADYIIEGSYIDERTWQGTYSVSTLIEGGSNYFNFANGMSAEDNLMFCEDTARFGFTIDITSAQALIMQGYATDTGIQLSWTQDDFDTLMGYNVYRSTSEDGYYQRINSTVIPADTKEFFDDTVEPGVMYYYNFTVVQTDLSESIPSGKISIMSQDTMAPSIYHTPVYTAYTGSNLLISATVTDNLNLSSVKAYYRVTGTEDWNTAVMSKLNDKYSAIIPASSLSLDGLEYYIEAYDGINYTYKGSAETPYSVTIQQAIDASSLGDVNGDGKISNLDALMLLQAINDKINLTSDQFTRADLDGNGVLQAFEALRILQYVSGTVGSVVIE